MSDDLLMLGMLSVEEAIELTRLSRAQVNRLIENGKLESVKLGGRRLVPRAAVLKLFRAGLDRARAMRETAHVA